MRVRVSVCHAAVFNCTMVGIHNTEAAAHRGSYEYKAMSDIGLLSDVGELVRQG